MDEIVNCDIEVLIFHYLSKQIIHKLMKLRNTFQSRILTNRGRAYRLPAHNKSIEMIQFHNATSQTVPPPNKQPLRINMSIRTLKSHRDSTPMNRTMTMEIQNQQEMESIVRPLNIVKYINITFTFDSQQIKFKSHAQSVGILSQQIKKLVVKKIRRYRPFVLQSSDNNYTLDYYLSQQTSKLTCFWGKTINLKPYYLTSQPNIELGAFQIVKCIGSGGFSKVFLGRYKANGQFYALKLISKSFIEKNKKQKLIMNQRNTMVESDHPLHVKLHWSFETRKYLVFVMDFYPGGELFRLVKKYRKLPEAIAKFYFVEILLAIQNLHDHGIAYRDLKPENILLDKEGHAHLADFGLVKPGLKCDGAKTYSFCGSPEYMPPEVIGRKGHSMTADFYSIGALLFELLTGLPPFYSNNPQKIYNATLKESIQLPSTFSNDLKSLLSGLLCKQNDSRLGANYGARQIFAHPWLSRLNLRDYVDKKIDPPVKLNKYSDLIFANDVMPPQKQNIILQMLEKEQEDKADFTRMFDNFDFCQNRYSQPFTQIRQNVSKTKNLKSFMRIRKNTQESPAKPLSRYLKVNNYL